MSSQKLQVDYYEKGAGPAESTSSCFRCQTDGNCPSEGSVALRIANLFADSDIYNHSFSLLDIWTILPSEKQFSFAASSSVAIKYVISPGLQVERERRSENSLIIQN